MQFAFWCAFQISLGGQFLKKHRTEKSIQIGIENEWINLPTNICYVHIQYA